MCSIDGKAVAVPWNAEKILVVDPAAGQASAIDLPAGVDERKELKFLSAINVNLTAS